jgi:hypothetical protein
MKAPILDPNFRYTPAAETDIAKTFARIRREQKRQAAAAAAPQPTKVAAIAGRRKS